VLLDRGSWQTAYKRLFSPAAAAARGALLLQEPVWCSNRLRALGKRSKLQIPATGAFAASVLMR